MEGNFRFRAKRVILTYSQIPEQFTKLELLNFFRRFGGIVKYIIAEETHEDGGRHIHAFFWMEHQFDTVNPRFFDLFEVHPHFQSVRQKGDPTDYYKYVTKEDKDPLTNLRKEDFQYPYEKYLEFQTEEEVIIELLKKQTSEKSPQFISLIRRLVKLQKSSGSSMPIVCKHNPQYFIDGKCLSCLRTTGEPFVREFDY